MFVSPGAEAWESGIPQGLAEPYAAGRGDTGEDRCRGQCGEPKLDPEWSQPASNSVWA